MVGGGGGGVGCERSTKTEYQLNSTIHADKKIVIQSK